AGGSADDWLADRDVDWLDSQESPAGRPASPPGAESPTQILYLGSDAVRRRRLVAGLVALVVVGAGIGVPLVVFRGGPSAQPTTTVQTTTAPPTTTAARTTTTT